MAVAVRDGGSRRLRCSSWMMTPGLLAILVFQFQWQRYRVLRADEGLEALALTDGTRPDVVVTDIARPGLDGLGLAQQMRAQPNPILGVPFVTKPFDPRNLVAVVARLLALAR